LAPLLAFSRSRLLRELDIRLERAAKSRERHLDGLLRQLENSAGADLFRRKGDLLLANLAAVPPGAKKVTLRDWNGREEVEIELNPGLSTARNAERYFKKYKKAHADPRGLQEEIASLRGAIEELRGQRDLLGSIEDPGKLEEAAQDVSDWLAPQAEGNKRAERGKKNAKKKERNGTPPLPPHLRFEAGGYTILVGLSARGNRFVTFKQAAGSDLWLHAHEIPGAHVVIKGAKGREELENTETLLFAASLAAAYSRDRNSLSVRVDYTERRHVRAVPGAATALVTYAHPGTIRVAPKPGALGPKESADGES
jgi:predicted ribosome quality control (RQC) complex YloA/Tae2 family protein